MYGAACSSKKEEHLAQVNEFVNLFVVLPIYPILPFFAESKAELRKQGQLIDDFDILIGVTAVANKMTLVSENLKHLSRIPNIKTENWIMKNDNIEYHKSFHRIPFTFYAQATCTTPESQYT